MVQDCTHKTQIQKLKLHFYDLQIRFILWKFCRRLTCLTDGHRLLAASTAMWISRRRRNVIRIFSWRNSGVWRSILLGLKRSDTIWKADNEIYLLTISDLGFRIEFWLFVEIFQYRHFSKQDLICVCPFILGSSFSNSKAWIVAG